MKSFKKGEILTADRLNELITSATAPSAAPGRSVAPRPGIHAQPGLARFNVQVEDSCTGEVSTLPDYAGLLKSVVYGSLDAPRIDRGSIILPLAHDYSPEDSSLPDETAAGGMRGVQVTAGLQRPMINRGLLGLPLAQSSWPQTAEGAMYTPGLVYGVQYDPVDDACEGSVLPRIDQGIIHLPAPTSGGGGGDGGITSCIFSGTVTAPTVKGTQLQLPYAEQANDICAGQATPVYTPGVLKHLSFAPDDCNACGYYPWIADGSCFIPTPIVALGGEDGKSALCNHLIDCEYAPITLSSCRLPDGTMLYLQGWTESNGQQLRLKITTENAYYY